MESSNMYMPVSPMNNGFGFGGDASWLIVLFLFAMMGGWGNGNNNMYPWMNNANQVSEGFRDQTLSNAINGIQTTMNNNQLAGVERAFDAQTAQNQQMSALQAQFAQCCCDNRLATTQTQNIIQTEAAATRAAIQAQTQAILDKMCQDKIDAKNEKIVELNNKINALESNNYIQNAITAQTQYLLNNLKPTTTTTG